MQLYFLCLQLPQSGYAGLLISSSLLILTDRVHLQIITLSLFQLSNIHSPQYTPTRTSQVCHNNIIHFFTCGYCCTVHHFKDKQEKNTLGWWWCCCCISKRGWHKVVFIVCRYSYFCLAANTYKYNLLLRNLHDLVKLA